MDLIDENGNLFGAVNVVDALAVLLVLAVVVAGVAVVGAFGSDDGIGTETETHYATVDLGTQPIDVAESIAAGDEWNHDGQDREITDVYATPASSDHASVTVRTEVAVPADGGTESVAGENVTIATDAYDVTGSVDAVEDAGSELPIVETDATLETTAPTETADEIQVGDEARIGDETVATIESVTVQPAVNESTRVVIGATLTTLETDDDLQYGHAALEPDSSIALATDDVALEPDVVHVGETSMPGEATTTTVEIDLEKLDDREADQFEPGLTDAAGGDTWATIRDVDREPASVVVETDDGDLHERQHPTKDDVTLTVELETRETHHERTFKGESLENGDTVYLDFGATSLEERAWIVDD